MVVFVDLEGDEEEFADLRNRPSLHYNPVEHLQKLMVQEETRPVVSRRLVEEQPSDGENGTSQPTERTPPSSFARALSAYPVARSLTTHLDLNDLHSLSLTCSSIHKSLNQFAANLITHSLTCTYAHQPLLSDLIAQYNASIIDSHRATPTDVSATPINHTIPNLLTAFSVPLYPQNRVAGGTRQTQNTGIDDTKRVFRTSKINPCACDLVSECRKCGTVVCRNCASKPPSDACLKDRFRRLCQVCLDAPLDAHLTPPHHIIEDSSPSSSSSSLASSSSSSRISLPPDHPTFTTPAFQRTPCTCPTHGVYLCQPCGHNLRSLDTLYKRVWTWRSRYSTHIGGGLGTGLGSGDQGQKCARGPSCLDNSSDGVCWVEIDCSEDSEPAPLTAAAAGENDEVMKAGYLRQEIEGIGGVVKKKVKKRVKVGGTVWEFDDERESGQYLAREASGQVRAWCGWCERVCLSKGDSKR